MTTKPQHFTAKLHNSIKKMPILHTLSSAKFKSPWTRSDTTLTIRSYLFTVIFDNYLASKLSMQTCEPKIGSAHGVGNISIFMPLDPLILQYVESISVGFKNNVQT